MCVYVCILVKSLRGEIEIVLCCACEGKMMGSFWVHLFFFLKSNSKDNWRNRHSVVRWQIFRFLQVRHRSTGSLKQIMRVWLQIRLTTNMAPIIGSMRTPVMLDEEVSTSGISHTSNADAVTGSWSLPHWVSSSNEWIEMRKLWPNDEILYINVVSCDDPILKWPSLWIDCHWSGGPSPSPWHDIMVHMPTFKKWGVWEIQRGCVYRVN